MSTKSRMRHLAAVGQRAEASQGWCDHCLETLATASRYRVFDYLIEAYWETEKDRENRQEFIDALETLAGALRSSGARYDYLCELEGFAESRGVSEEEWATLVAWLRLKGEKIDDNA